MSEASTTARYPAVLVVGGRGAMGQLFARLFAQAGFEVRVLEPEDELRAAELVAGVLLVLVAVPIDRTVARIASLPPLPESCVLADVTSVKRAPLAAMLAAHPGPVVGLHPMFGPDVADLRNQVIVFCEGRDTPGCAWLLDLLAARGARLCAESAEGHDEAMQLVQALRHFSTIAYGLFLQRERADLARLLRLSSPIYRLELGMVGRLFAQDPALYADIMLQAEELPALVARYRDVQDDLLAVLGSSDRTGLIERFGAARAHFGELAPALLEESGALLRRMVSDD